MIRSMVAAVLALMLAGCQWASRNALLLASDRATPDISAEYFFQPNNNGARVRISGRGDGDFQFTFLDSKKGDDTIVFTMADLEGPASSGRPYLAQFREKDGHYEYLVVAVQEDTISLYMPKCAAYTAWKDVALNETKNRCEFQTRAALFKAAEDLTAAIAGAKYYTSGTMTLMRVPKPS